MLCARHSWADPFPEMSFSMFTRRLQRKWHGWSVKLQDEACSSGGRTSQLGARYRSWPRTAWRYMDLGCDHVGGEVCIVSATGFRGCRECWQRSLKHCKMHAARLSHGVTSHTASALLRPKFLQAFASGQPSCCICVIGDLTLSLLECQSARVTSTSRSETNGRPC